MVFGGGGGGGGPGKGSRKIEFGSALTGEDILVVGVAQDGRITHKVESGGAGVREDFEVGGAQVLAAGKTGVGSASGQLDVAAAAGALGDDGQSRAAGGYTGELEFVSRVGEVGLDGVDIFAGSIDAKVNFEGGAFGICAARRAKVETGG